MGWGGGFRKGELEEEEITHPLGEEGGGQGAHV